MTKNINAQPASCRTVFCLLGLLVFLSACNKEVLLKESNKDTNYYVNYDNPNDPIDHAIFNFYKRTGIAAFSKDTIAKIKTSKEGESPERYKHIVLKPSYNLMGNDILGIYPLVSRDPIPDVLNLIETRVLPKLPKGFYIPCILFATDVNTYVYANLELIQGHAAFKGFDALVVKAVDMQSMTDKEKDVYAASILAGCAEGLISRSYNEELQANFYSISRKLMKTYTTYEAYSGLPYMFAEMATSPNPLSVGFFKHVLFPFMDIMELESMPTENTDLRAFLAAVFVYTTSEFESLYSDHPKVIEKFNVLRRLVELEGYKLP